MTKLYIDTNVFVYAFEDSKNLFGGDISSSASRLFFEAISCKYQVIISSWALEELAGLRKLEQAHMLFTLLKQKVLKIEHTSEDVDSAKKASPRHFHDELHGLLAIKAGADYIVTRNTQDFVHFKERIPVVKPEWLL